ncbi:PREDICTED: DNA repair protein RAD50-like, partial [Trachymyrmex cornetzi]|uniref:DNA repair protein RAD50-like n=1 Tax=Trachymyrmex cornetzi TaxID=471704 RepID=UPI00084EEF6B
METAPVLFTSNMSEKEIEDKRELAINMLSNNENIVILDNNLINDDNNAKMIDSQDHEFDIYFNKNKIDETNKEHLNDNDVTIVELQDTLLKKCNKEISNIANVQRKKRKLQKLLNTEDNLQAQRIQQIINQEQDLATVKIRHEENMNKMREDHLKRLNEMEILHKTEMNKLEMEINKTKLK